MAGGVKKGFATYLFILFLAVIASFLTIVVIMLFKPFNNILGFQYFIYASEDYRYNVTTTKDDDVIDFSTIEQINIDCDYAQVQIRKFNKVDNIAIRFTNNSKGFARYDQDTSFSYEITYAQDSNKIINITVHEPEGFLYFSRDVEIDILIPVDSAYAFENTALNINNVSGDILIGNNAPLVEGETNIGLNSFNLKTISGEIIVFPYIDNNVNDVFIKTETGNIDVRANLNVSDSFQIYSKESKIELNNVNLTNQTNNIILNLKNSKLFASVVTGDIDLTMDSGYIEMTTLNGSISSNNAVEQMGNARIKINLIDGGNISFPYANNSQINVEEIKPKADGTRGQVYIHATSGSVTIGKMYAEGWIETETGNINLHTFADDISVITTTGRIDVVYEGITINNQLDFKTNSGDINISIRSDLAFTLQVYNTKNELRDGSNISIEFYNGQFKNPLQVNNGTKLFNIVSDGKIDIGLVNI